MTLDVDCWFDCLLTHNTPHRTTVGRNGRCFMLDISACSALSSSVFFFHSSLWIYTCKSVGRKLKWKLGEQKTTYKNWIRIFARVNNQIVFRNELLSFLLILFFVSFQCFNDSMKWIFSKTKKKNRIRWTVQCPRTM